MNIPDLLSMIISSFKATKCTGPVGVRHLVSVTNGVVTVATVNLESPLISVRKRCLTTNVEGT